MSPTVVRYGRGRREHTRAGATIETISESAIGFHDAVERGVAQINRTLENVRAIWVTDEEIVVGDGAIQAYRVQLNVTLFGNSALHASPANQLPANQPIVITE